ncbi:hypothetical protein LIA77_00160 [Sarocladium implicatum]|nr:hypothetical protein LIA77_00160 [Sarocladium implicatum]
MKLSAGIILAMSASMAAAAPTPEDVPPPPVDETLLDVALGYGLPGFCCHGMCPIEPVEDPQIKDTIHHRQVTETLECPAGGSACSIGTTEAYTIGYSVDIGGMIPWASIGLGVQQSWTSSTTKTCGGNVGGSTCMWVRTPMKTWTARKKGKYAEVDTCKHDEGAQPDGPYRVTAPAGEPQFYCVNGDACRTKDQGYVQDPDEAPKAPLIQPS